MLKKKLTFPVFLAVARAPPWIKNHIANIRHFYFGKSDHRVFNFAPSGGILADWLARTEVYRQRGTKRRSFTSVYKHLESGRRQRFLNCGGFCWASESAVLAQILSGCRVSKLARIAASALGAGRSADVLEEADFGNRA